MASFAFLVPGAVALGLAAAATVTGVLNADPQPGSVAFRAAEAEQIRLTLAGRVDLSHALAPGSDCASAVRTPALAPLAGDTQRGHVLLSCSDIAFFSSFTVRGLILYEDGSYAALTYDGNTPVLADDALARGSWHFGAAGVELSGTAREPRVTAWNAFNEARQGPAGEASRLVRVKLEDSVGEMVRITE